MQYFPSVIIFQKHDGIEGLAGLALKSILQEDLLDSINRTNKDYLHYLSSKHQHILQKSREAFIHALSSMPKGLSLELHFNSLPNHSAIAQSRFYITLFIRCIGKKEECIKENILVFFLSLKSILATHITEAEFIPITDQEELRQKWQADGMTHSLSILRRRETLALSAPLKKLAIGFGSATEKDPDTEMSVHHIFPWLPSYDKWDRLVSTLLAQLDPHRVIIRLKPAHVDESVRQRLTETIRRCDRFIATGKDEEMTIQTQANQVRKISLRQLSRLTETCFNLGVFLLASHPLDNSLGNILGKAVTGLRSEIDEEKMFQGGFACKEIAISTVFEPHYFPDEEIFTLPEAACAFRLPSPPNKEMPGLQVKRSRTSLALLPEQPSSSDCITLAINEHQGTSQPIRVSADDRMRHAFIIGQTGTGKSTLMENMILQDIKAGRGLAVIDPHGEMIDSIIGKIPAERIEDTILFDLLDRERPFGFNLLEWKTIEERDLIIDDLYLTLDRLYDMKQVGGPMFESNFRGMLKLLMGDKPRQDFIPTLLEFTQCYLDEKFRRWLQKSIEDPQTTDFIRELERTGGEASLVNMSPYITSKFSRFTHDITLKRIVGQEKTAIDFEDIMNNGKVLLLKLGKGRFGSNISGLIVNQIVSRFKLAALKRGEKRLEKRRDFFLYVDECHNLPQENFMELLAEARKYRMGLILATQYTAQLSESSSKRDTLLSAILGNVGTTVIFRLGQEDAEKLAPNLHPCFTSKDIVGLPNWQGYIRLQIANTAISPFSFHTIKENTPFHNKTESRIIVHSLTKYGEDVQVIDALIQTRRNVWKK